MSHPTVYDAVGSVLEVGSRVQISGFDPPEARPGTVARLLDDEHGVYAAVEFPDYESLSDTAGPDRRCPDLLLINDEEKGDGDATR